MRGVDRVVRSFAIDGQGDRVVLFSWSANPDPLNRNVARLDRFGNVVWRAELPAKADSDCFTNLAVDANGFVARTFSEWLVHLDGNGRLRHLERESCRVD